MKLCIYRKAGALKCVVDLPWKYEESFPKENLLSTGGSAPNHGLHNPGCAWWYCWMEGSWFMSQLEDRQLWSMEMIVGWIRYHTYFGELREKKHKLWTVFLEFIGDISFVNNDQVVGNLLPRYTIYDPSWQLGMRIPDQPSDGITRYPNS